MRKKINGIFLRWPRWQWSALGLHAVALFGLSAAMETGCRLSKKPGENPSAAPTASSTPDVARIQEEASDSDTDTADGWVHEETARSDPLSFVKQCRQHYLENVRDYSCRFHMRERAGGTLPEEQVIAIKFRETPYSVDMRWLQNARGAKRISYVADRWVKGGKQLALVVPGGLGGVVAPGGVKLDIHGAQFRAASSRTVNQFGFRKTLERMIELCEKTKGRPGYDLRYAGRGELDGRPCYIIERRLPYSSDGEFPDRLAVFHIDREWLVPSGVWSYADEQKQELLGSFITKNTEFNVGLTDADFE